MLKKYWKVWRWKLENQTSLLSLCSQISETGKCSQGLRLADWTIWGIYFKSSFYVHHLCKCCLNHLVTSKSPFLSYVSPTWLWGHDPMSCQNISPATCPVEFLLFFFFLVSWLLLKLILWPRILSGLANILGTFEKNVYSALVEYSVFTDQLGQGH